MPKTLKEVSKAKLRILEKYFPGWALILGSWNPLLVYVDCFAGAGKYESGEVGSPLVVLRTADAITHSGKFRVLAIFVEKNHKSAERLRGEIKDQFPHLKKLSTQNANSDIQWDVFNEDAHDFVPHLLQAIPDGTPAFFFIDPFGHPLSIPLMNKILSRKRSEIFVTLMWYAINMHLNNPRVKRSLTEKFGDGKWQNQSFMSKSGIEREKEFLEYFCSLLQAKYILKFRIRFSPEDRVHGREHRTKYYLLHLSNHPKAALLMKEVMWPIGDEEGTFDYSARHQGVLFSSTPQVKELIEYLRQSYVGSGKQLTFDKLREETWMLPFIEKHYREALKTLEKENLIRIARVKSKKTGIKGEDIIIF